tara:strand:- start:252 stop:470 length:219 start_codon:yes stop_codon:yes gene_type:complete
MKIVLILYMCSYVGTVCLPGHQWPDTFDDMYDCLQLGYEESSKKLKELGRKDVNEHEIFVRFACVKQESAET